MRSIRFSLVILSLLFAFSNAAMAMSLPSDVQKLDVERQPMLKTLGIRPPEPTDQIKVDLKSDLTKADTAWQQYRESMCRFEATRQSAAQILNRKVWHRCLLTLTRQHNAFFRKALN